MIGPAIRMVAPAIGLAFVWAGVYASAASLVPDVRLLAEQGQYSKAAGYVKAYEAEHGRSPASILALSWLGRVALTQKKYDLAERYARDTYEEVLEKLKHMPLDREPDLVLALGASLEVQGQVLVARGERTAAISMLEAELRKYPNTPLAVRIRKNINLLSLEGKPAPFLAGIALPNGKPALLFFWAHWCGDCRVEAPILAQLKKEFGPRGLRFIGPTQKYGYIGSQTNVPGDREIAYIEEIRRDYYGAVIDGPPVVSEANFLTYGVSTTPTVVLVDRGGIVRLYHPGAMKYTELRAAIDGMLAHR
jgi:thiol-disulfide isomerase/thioredoxin